MKSILSVSYTLTVGGRAFQGNLILPSDPDTFNDDVRHFQAEYPMLDVGFYTLSTVPEGHDFPVPQQ